MEQQLPENIMRKAVKGISYIAHPLRLRILELGRERNLSVNQMARTCKIQHTTLHNTTGGRNRSITVYILQTLCDGLGITLADFFNSPLFENLEQEIC